MSDKKRQDFLIRDLLIKDLDCKISIIDKKIQDLALEKFNYSYTLELMKETLQENEELKHKLKSLLENKERQNEQA